VLNGHALNGAPLNGTAGANLISATIAGGAEPVAGTLYHNFAGAIVDGQPLRYVCDLTGDPPLRLPISSWQATVQRGRASFVQAVVPGVGDYVDEIEARLGGEIVISRVAALRNGLTLEHELARGALSDFRRSRGPTRHTGTLAGYGDPVEAPGGQTVTLQDVRSIEVQPQTVRARAAVDWLLRPGDTAVAGDQSFEVAYANYYVTGADSYMDAGSRAE